MACHGMGFARSAWSRLKLFLGMSGVATSGREMSYGCAPGRARSYDWFRCLYNKALWVFIQQGLYIEDLIGLT